jgi:sarcosine oxidase subunit gamma
MAKAATAAGTAALRRPARSQAGREFAAPHAGGDSGVAVLPPAERISLRAPEASVAALSKALGVKLPREAEDLRSTKGRTALWLGPDEWLVIDEAGGDPLADCAKVKELHSAVGVSHRNVAFAVSGKGAEATINAGCPQDLSLTAFPVGACSRTVLGKIEIVLLAHRGGRLPRRMLAVVLRLRLHLPVGRRARRGGLTLPDRCLTRQLPGQRPGLGDLDRDSRKPAAAQERLTGRHGRVRIPRSDPSGKRIQVLECRSTPTPVCFCKPILPRRSGERCRANRGGVGSTYPTPR